MAEKKSKKIATEKEAKKDDVKTSKKSVEKRTTEKKSTASKKAPGTTRKTKKKEKENLVVDKEVVKEEPVAQNTTEDVEPVKETVQTVETVKEVVEKDIREDFRTGTNLIKEIKSGQFGSIKKIIIDVLAGILIFGLFVSINGNKEQKTPEYKNISIKYNTDFSKEIVVLGNWEFLPSQDLLISKDETGMYKEKAYISIGSFTVDEWNLITTDLEENLEVDKLSENKIMATINIEGDQEYKELLIFSPEEKLLTEYLIIDLTDDELNKLKSIAN